MSLSFLHLSDIHFRYKRTGTRHDLDLEVRHELGRDIDRFVQGGYAFDGLLVSGDIAFGGEEEEYIFARKWLDDLCGVAKCEPLNVWCIPGNHDVYRQEQKRVSVSLLHERLRESGADLDETLRQICEDNIDGLTLFKPFDGYNFFAKDYRCETTPYRTFWEDDSLSLGQGYRVRLRGINSALICNKDDGSTPRNQLVVGGTQAMHLRKDDEVLITMCHHPSPWLADESSFEHRMQLPDSVLIQLFGHEHRFQAQKHKDFLRLNAGAVHPDRGADWLPRYNVISLSVDQDEVGPILVVKVFPRAWTSSNLFRSDPDSCDGGDSFEWRHRLPRTPGNALQELGFILGSESEKLDSGDAHDSKPLYSSTDLRRLAYSFANLPFTQSFSVAAELNLLRDEDEHVGELDRRRGFFLRAQDAGLLAELWDRVRLSDHSLESHNPFRV